MSQRLFNLSGVPEDEADEVRALLQEQGMDFYETPAGRWGFSVHAIWLRDPAQVERARQLLADYQRQRALRVRAEYRQLRQAGGVPTFWRRLRAQPVRMALLLLLALLVLYVSVKPFLDFTR